MSPLAEAILILGYVAFLVFIAWYFLTHPFVCECYGTTPAILINITECPNISIKEIIGSSQIAASFNVSIPLA